MSIVLMPSSHFIPWHPFLLPSIFHSIRDFSNKSVVHIRWPKSWSFNFSINPSKYLVLISHKIDWFDLLAVQGTHRSLLQHHSLKASVLWCSAFLMVQLSQPYITTGNTIALTILNFFGKVMSLLFKTLSLFIISFLPRSSHYLISWLKSPSAVILEPKKRKSVTASTFSPSICHEMMGLHAMILVFSYLVLSWLFRSPPSPSSMGSLVPLCFLPLEKCLYHLHIWGCWCFPHQSWFQLVNSSSPAFLMMCSG